MTKLAAELDELEEAKEAGALSLREYMRFRDATTAAPRRRAGGAWPGTRRRGRWAASPARPGRCGRGGTNPATTLDQRQAVVRAVIDRVVIAPVGRSGNRFDDSRVKIVPV